VAAELRTGGVAKETVSFLEQSLMSEKERLQESEQHAKDNFLMSPSDGRNTVMGLGSGLGKPFLENHAAQVP
tara:strand:+ start:180 stop:395 length:216 start_codon:yes stop_codon:yes gene_type:complete